MRYLTTRLQRWLSIARMVCANEAGAFTLTNKIFPNWNDPWLPACHKERNGITLASGTVTDTTVDTTIVGLKFMRIRGLVKTLTGLASADSVLVTVQAGTGAALTGRENILTVRVTMFTSDALINFQQLGWSNAGFQSYAVTIRALVGDVVDTGATPVVDYMIDCM